MAKESVPSIDLSDAKAALHDFVDRDGQDAADKLTQIFAGAATKIAKELTRATRTVRSPLQQIAGSVLGQLGAMAVDKVFRAGAPSSDQTSRGGVIVNFHVGAGADAESIRRNQAQIAAQVARAVDYGNRNR